MEKAVGIVRKIDDLGRVVIPAVLRKQFGIQKLDDVEMLATESGIILRKYEGNNIDEDIKSIISKYEYDGVNNKRVDELKELLSKAD